MSWIAGVTELRRRGEAGVLATIIDSRGHAPRGAGAKMVVAAGRIWGTIGGGNLESVAIDAARAMLAEPGAPVRTMAFELSDRAPLQHGVQCCGGTVNVLLEPLPAPASVAIFGMGHVGIELARVLARHEIALHLVDSRAERLTDEMLAPLADAEAEIHVHVQPLLPEAALAEMPAGTHVVIMTHDHAEDHAVLDAALRRPDLGSVGLIGSAGKWARFRKRFLDEGFTEDDLARVTTPIGLADLGGKEPAVIAVSVAAALLIGIQQARSAAGRARTES